MQLLNLTNIKSKERDNVIVEVDDCELLQIDRSMKDFLVQLIQNCDESQIWNKFLVC